jgi:hypothetical protein
LIDDIEYPPQLGDLNRLWVRGGLPDSLLDDDDGDDKAPAGEGQLTWLRTPFL